MQPAAKRQRRSDSLRPAYPRRRAVEACQTCRARKTKCDNVRPSCGFCTRIGTRCVFETTESDFSSFDPASLKILDRLNAVAADVQTLLARTTSNSSISNAAPVIEFPIKSPLRPISIAPSTASPEQGAAPPPPPLISVSPPSTTDTQNSDVVSETLNFPTEELHDEKILSWPIFELPFTITPLIENLLDAEADYSSEAEDYSVNQDPPTSELWSLVDSFLLNVHIKNPILDFQRLRKSAANIIQNGFKWDEESCLMLHVCALGAVSSPYSSLPNDDLTIDSSATSLGDSLEELERSKLYYREASKRLSIVRKFSLVQIQCYVLSGIYLMFTMRPLVAWRQFHLACVSCQIYFKRQNRDSDWTDVDRSLEQRLFWTAFKSECEIRSIIPTPPSGIIDFLYPSMFPSPPSVVYDESAENSEQHSPEEIHILKSSVSSSVERKSWFYYLTEIALRKIENRMISVLYSNSNETWLDLPFEHLTELVTEVETQLSLCHSNIVPEIKFVMDHIGYDDEVKDVLQARFWEIYKLTYRPLLYIAIHSAKPLDETQHAFITPRLDKMFHYMLNSCMHYRHRHHGTWFSIHCRFVDGALILAGVKSRKLPYDDPVRRNIERIIEVMRYWESESSDLKAVRTILEYIWTDVRMRLDMGGILV
ncbi:hypothetical protein BZA70DRAFT_271865 [Myxozyma melibiosi]|uniref:Zn(2)-C6 fungal-type domain-containing protein n=1 Tax=Myxozyma melibiosi TaxID=54550 RepID=A0ABR1FCR9_9ASCO